VTYGYAQALGPVPLHIDTRSRMIRSEDGMCSSSQGQCLIEVRSMLISRVIECMYGHCHFNVSKLRIHMMLLIAVV
jgi:hypothetical protein